MTRAALALALLAALAGRAAADDELTGTAVVFARGGALYRASTAGRGETQLATLPAKAAVRALRTDAAARALLVDLDGAWSWMPLDGSATSLAPLPCADGPAQLAEDGTCVLCRAAKGDGALIIQLATGKQLAVAVPPGGARLIGAGATRRVVWADSTGVWSAPPANLRARQQVAAEPPLRAFSIGPDGTRAVGVYPATVHADGKQQKPAELLMMFALDGVGARRKAIRAGVALEWSHDGQWVLVQDGGNACIMRATGGQYKCWKGYTAASISADGKWALVLGTRGKAAPAKPSGNKGNVKTPRAAAPPPTDNGGEGVDSGEAAGEDTAVPPPSGPLSLYRAKLEGAFTDPPTLVESVIDGAAVWLPAAGQ